MKTEWYKEAFIYHIYPLGMLTKTKYLKDNYDYKNNLSELYNWIDYWKYLNINAIYFSPIFKSTSHGYDTIDYYNIDPRLGDNKSFSELVKNLKENGIKVIVDGVFNHVSRDFHQFQDVLKHKQNSMFCNWFYLDFNKKSVYGDSFYYEGWEGHYNLVKLNLKNPYVKEYIFNAVKKWILEFDISGIRLDVAYLLDEEFIKELKELCRSLKADFWIMGEVINGDYRKYMSDDKLDSTTNYECYKGIYSSHNDYNYFEISHSLNRLFSKNGIYKDFYLYNFIDNHDVTKASSIIKNKNHLLLMYVILMTMSGIPSIYYGSEIGIEGLKEKGDDNLRPKLNFSQIKELIKNNKIFEGIKNLSDIRKNNKILINGSFEILHTNNKQLVYSRYDENDNCIIILNMDDKFSNITLTHINKEGLYINLLDKDSKEVYLNKKMTIEVQSNSAMILKFIK